MFTKNETFYIPTGTMSTEEIEEIINSLGEKGFRYIQVSETDIEDNKKYFLAVNPRERITYMDSNSSDNIQTKEYISVFS
jgi:hypothetical protein